jgi:hypothetical protein
LRADATGPRDHIPAALRALRRRLDTVAVACPAGYRADLIGILRECADTLEKTPHRNEEREAG